MHAYLLISFLPAALTASVLSFSFVMPAWNSYTGFSLDFYILTVLKLFILVIGKHLILLCILTSA